VQCQLDCQTQVYNDCEQQMVEQCNTECETTGGAIFCDGQFLNVTDVDDCAAELAAEIDIEVDLDIQADVDVDINPPSSSSNDDDDDENNFSCAVQGGANPGSSGSAPTLLGLLGAVWAARRLRRSTR
jgi:MYXO-CTERM domain-containing protein